MKIRLDAELVRRELARSREHASDLIEARTVLVNGIPASKPATMVDAETSIKLHGKRDDFVETFPDEGDVDFVKAVKVYREVGYEDLLMPDHAPVVPGQPDASRENFPFEFGYIRGLIEAERHII
jgi:ribosomal protein S4